MSEGDGIAGTPTPLKRLVPFLIVTMVALFADLLTKHLAFAILGPPNKNPEFWLLKNFLGFRTTANYGSLFGFFQGAGWLLIPASFAAAAVIIYLLLRRTTDRFTMWVLSFLLAGVLGNLYDRLVHGYVRDFIGLHFGSFTWPYFNLADAYITVGIIMLVVRSLFTKEKAVEEEKG